MQGNAKRRLKNAALFAGAPLFHPQDATNDPYTGQQTQYFSPGTQEFIWENAKYSDNYFAARVQGAIPGNFEDIRGAYIRTMDLVEQSTGSNASNDWQLIYFQDPRIHGLYTGAKVWYGGNVWIATSPRNFGSASGNSVVRRCNALWHYLDYYGNIKSEPFVWAKGPAQATANEYLDYTVIPNSYQKCVMQLNDATKEVALNRRIILGTSAFDVRGVVDFVSDFSEEGENEEAGKTHILFFDLFEREPLAIDDMENGVAGGKTFKWEILLSGSEQMAVGAEQKLSVQSLRNGEAPDGEYPVDYLFESSDPSVLSIDENGRILANKAGEATVTVVLAQNGKYQSTFQVTVTEDVAQQAFVFTPPLPDSLRQLQSVDTDIAFTQGTGTISMRTFGADSHAYTAALTGNRLTIEAWGASPERLGIELSCGSAKETFYITLKGY